VLSIGTKIVDLGWPWTADTHSVAEMMRFRSPVQQFVPEIKVKIISGKWF